MPDVLFILLLALVVLGPKRLPQIASRAGKYLAQFQRMKREVLDQVNAEILRLEKQNTLGKTAVGNDDPSPMLASAGPGLQSLKDHT